MIPARLLLLLQDEFQESAYEVTGATGPGRLEFTIPYNLLDYTFPGKRLEFTLPKTLDEFTT